jgi:hypothetical protein
MIQFHQVNLDTSRFLSKKRNSRLKKVQIQVSLGTGNLFQLLKLSIQ